MQRHLQKREEKGSEWKYRVIDLLLSACYWFLPTLTLPGGC